MNNDYPKGDKCDLCLYQNDSCYYLCQECEEWNNFKSKNLYFYEFYKFYECIEDW